MTSLPDRLIVLCIGGLTWDHLDASPAARQLSAQGTRIGTLLPVPITGRRTQTTQLLTGQNPGRTGDFDELTVRDYVVEPAPEVARTTLRQAIEHAGRTVNVEELALAAVPERLASVGEAPRVLVLTAALDAAAGDDTTALDDAVAAAHAWSGADGVCVIVAPFRTAPVTAFVNLNDGLAELGALERDTQAAGDAASGIAWSETLAYHVGNGQIWINLEGRAPAGIVAAGEEYERVVRALAASLPTKLRDPRSGEPVVERVQRRADLYAGESLFRAPDLIVELRPGYAPSAASRMLTCEQSWVQPAPSDTWGVEGMHPTTVAGLAIAHGAPFAPALHIATAGLLDVAPTLLHALGIAIPPALQGAVLTDAFAPEFLASFPVRQGDQDNGLTAEDEADITARLQSLGYLG